MACKSYADTPPAYDVKYSEETATAEAASPWRFDGHNNNVRATKFIIV